MPNSEITAWLLTPMMLAAMIAVTGPANLMGDFRAFYCAGAAIAHGANPYLEEPLHSCEQRTRTPHAEHAPIGDLARAVAAGDAAPLRAALAASVPHRSKRVWRALVAAMSGAVVLFARATGVSSVWLNVAFAAITAAQTYFLGQPVPFAFLALAACSFWARQGRWVAASACAMLATGEPHLALPVLLALPCGAAGASPILASAWSGSSACSRSGFQRASHISTSSRRMRSRTPTNGNSA